MLERATELIKDPDVSENARHRVLYRMLYRLDQDMGMETSPYSESRPYRSFDWVEEIAPPPDPLDGPQIDWEEVAAEQEEERRRQEEDAAYEPRPDPRL